MKNRNNKPTLTVDALGIKLKVIRVGESPQLKRRNSNSQDSEKVGHIHSHFTYEVFFVTEGILKIVTGNRTLSYERKVVIIPPRTEHYTVTDMNGSFCLLFSFEKNRKGEFKAEQISSVLQNRICELPLSDDIEYYIKAVSRKSAENTSTAEKDAELLTTLVFREIFSALMPKNDELPINQNDSKHIGEIETYINSNLNKKITLTDIAARVFLSTRQVSRILKKEYGCTLSQLVIQKKLAYAVMLLKNTDMSIGDITRSVNLGAENYFYTLFKNKYGISPLRFRKQNT